MKLLDFSAVQDVFRKLTVQRRKNCGDRSLLMALPPPF
jgi:hypothetical protein